MVYIRVIFFFFFGQSASALFQKSVHTYVEEARTAPHLAPLGLTSVYAAGLISLAAST